MQSRATCNLSAPLQWQKPNKAQWRQTIRNNNLYNINMSRCRPCNSDALPDHCALGPLIYGHWNKYRHECQGIYEAMTVTPWEVQKHCILIIVKWKVHRKLPFLFSTRYCGRFTATRFVGGQKLLLADSVRHVMHHSDSSYCTCIKQKQ